MIWCLLLVRKRWWLAKDGAPIGLVGGGGRTGMRAEEILPAGSTEYSCDTRCEVHILPIAFVKMAMCYKYVENRAYPMNIFSQ